MKKLRLLLIASLFTSGITFGQCDLDFGSGAVPQQFTFTTLDDPDIVNAALSGLNESNTQSFDIWDEATNDCGTTGGLDDITFDFEILNTFDHYDENIIIDYRAQEAHDITQSSSGLRGSIPLGTTSKTETTTGDVRGYKITVTFADHVFIEAQALTVDLTSVNTAGKAHESCAIIFLDENGAAYGTATYEGFYTGTSGASRDATCGIPTIRTNSWTTSATGAYTASSTSTNNMLDPCNPTSGSSGTGNNYDVNAETDAGLNATDRIGGFEFIVHLEDVAASTADGAETLTNTSFTSTLNGVSIASLVLPVDLIAFNAKEKDDNIALSWSTASEENNDHFDVEWSVDGDRFEKIGEVKGIGNSFEIQDYHFVHDQPINGENYYRLKQVDWNERFEYSEVKSVNIEIQEGIQIYPSLVNSELNLIKPKGKSNILIYGINGSLIQQINGQEGQLLQINTNDLPKGNFIISVQTNDRFYIERFIKL